MLTQASTVVGMSAVLILLVFCSGGGKRGWHSQHHSCRPTTFGGWYFSSDLLYSSTANVTLPASGGSVEFMEWLPPHRLLYASNAMVYPIRGALRYTYGGQWEVR